MEAASNLFRLYRDTPRRQSERQDLFHEVFVVETKGIHLTKSEDAEYKQSVIDICNQHARKSVWAMFAFGKRGRVIRLKVVDEDK